MALRERLQGKETQFHVELVYGLLFIVGFGFLAFRVDPRVAAFEGGLIVGYLLRVWEKMAIYERVLERAVSAEAETQVVAEVDEQVSEAVDTEVEAQVGDIDQRIDTEVEDAVAEEFEAELDETVEEEVEEAVEAEIEAELEELDIDGIAVGRSGDEEEA